MEFTGNLVGMNFRPPAKAVTDNMPSPIQVICRRQHDNPHDENAIQVLLRKEDIPEDKREALEKIIASECERLIIDDVVWPLHLGYIDRKTAAEASPKIDLGLDSSFENPAYFAGEAFIAATGKWQVKAEPKPMEIEIDFSGSSDDE